jgi:signal transduction histidine kinase/CheY-like chemotaxis protein
MGAEDEAWAVLDTAPVPCATLDEDGTVTRANSAFWQLTGFGKSAPLTPQRLADMVSARERARLIEHLHRIQRAQGPIEAQLEVTTRGRRAVRLHLSNCRDARGVSRPCWLTAVEIRREPTGSPATDEQLRLAEKKWQDERDRSRAKDQFLATLSHELRTPLTPALLAASLLPRLERLTPHGRQMIASIQRSIETEVKLIDDLLDITRITRDKLRLELSIVDVHGLLRESLAVCRAEAEGKGISIEMNAAAVQSRVSADPVRLKQVFWNLLQNAIKYTPAAGRVAIDTTNDTAGGVRVCVSDTGVGIEPRHLPLLFQPFEQVSATHGGLGLGLAICKGIVDAHGGDIWVTSPGRGAGAVFEVRLSAATSTAAAPAAERRSSLVSTESIRILLVEDHADSAEMLAMALRSAGHVVEVASSVREAVRCLDECWDAVISDLGLPDGSGIDVARHCARLVEPPRIRIALSGYGMPSDIESSHHAGFQQHLVKPVDLKKLLDLLASR